MSSFSFVRLAILSLCFVYCRQCSKCAVALPCFCFPCLFLLGCCLADCLVGLANTKRTNPSETTSTPAVPFVLLKASKPPDRVRSRASVPPSWKHGRLRQLGATSWPRSARDRLSLCGPPNAPQNLLYCMYCCCASAHVVKQAGREPHSIRKARLAREHRLLCPTCRLR